MKNEIKQAIRNLRRGQTRAEELFWQQVRGRKLGVKFLRQHPIFFIWEDKKRLVVADFYCCECSLVVEIDGGIHKLQKNYDDLRTRVLNKLGLRVLRFTNKEIEDDIDGVLEKLRKYIK